MFIIQNNRCVQRLWEVQWESFIKKSCWGTSVRVITIPLTVFRKKQSQVAYIRPVNLGKLDKNKYFNERYLKNILFSSFDHLFHLLINLILITFPLMPLICIKVLYKRIHLRGNRNLDLCIQTSLDFRWKTFILLV